MKSKKLKKILPKSTYNMYLNLKYNFNSKYHVVRRELSLHYDMDYIDEKIDQYNKRLYPVEKSLEALTSVEKARKRNFLRYNLKYYIDNIINQITKLKNQVTLSPGEKAELEFMIKLLNAWYNKDKWDKGSIAIGLKPRKKKE